MNDGNKSSGAFFNGFLLGLIIGAGAVFLFGTKRGKKVLKTITEEGFDGITLSDFISDEEDREGTKPRKNRSQGSGREEKEVIEEIDEEEFATNGEEEEPSFQTVATKAKRLFRGIPKRKN